MGYGGSVTKTEISPGSADEPEGNTPLDEDEAADLIPTHLTTRGQLNSWEQANINNALEWLHRRREQASPLEIDFLKDLHRKMFGSTWRWAGRFRTTEKSIGVAPYSISELLANLLADTAHWLKHNTYSVDEIAVRFHHRLVSIHPFPNGNGRHARLAADLLLESLGVSPFSWGSADLNYDVDVRSRYLNALRQADRGQIAALLTFARS